MKRSSLLVRVSAWLSLLVVAAPAVAQITDVEIPYTSFTLANGLRVVVHEDHKAPIVAVSVWYNVGSKDEPEGKTGFAHLFEHLMFNGTENYNDEYFKPFHEVGATSMNGTTWFDRTNYFETVPTPALELALWMESDRMGHLLGAIDQAKLDEQRGVVQNEKRQGDNQPYGMAGYRIQEGLYPPGHPYRHDTIGSMEDLNAASLDDVKEWFRTYYGAANAVIVLAGDVTAEQARPLVEKYFGNIEAGPALTRVIAEIPTRDHDTEEVMYERVPQTRIYRGWVIPGRTEQDRAVMELAARILGTDKNSRLYQELIYKNQLASNVSVYVEEHLLASNFMVEVTLRPEAFTTEVEAIIDQVFSEFLAKPASNEEVQRAKTGIESLVIRGLEQVGGFGGKASTLAEGELYANDPAFYKKLYGWIERASAEDIRAVSAHWLGQGRYQLTVLPFDDFSVSGNEVDRAKGPPAPGAMPGLKFPAIERATLNNGITVVLAESHTVPVVNVALQFDAGYAADSAGFKLGTSGYTLAMMDEGTKDLDALEISARAELLGASISTGSNLDMSSASLSALKKNLDESLALFADVVRNPAFPEEEIERLRGRWIAGIAQEKTQPVGIALRNLAPMLYGTGHAYGIPMTGTGTEASIASLSRDDLVNFYQTWIRPDNATMFVVGDTTMKEILPRLNRAFGDWKAPRTERREKNIAMVNGQDSNRLVVVDKPGAPQSVILAGQLAPPTGVDNNIAIETMNEIIGGNFNSRVNMNLREDKHWAYGAYTVLQDARGQRPFLVYAPVQTDKTGASIAELQKELRDYLAEAPASEEELTVTVQNQVNSLPGAFETAGAVLGSLLGNQRFGRPDDYVTTLTQRYRNLDLTSVRGAAREVIKPDGMIWMVIGDKQQITEQLAGMDLGEVVYMDADGNVIK
ncbi:MAG: insulinase family protein [Gammaproteobacteria bacterium]|nr:insulinase family protein [Gammaproteobacteria bacterium]